LPAALAGEPPELLIAGFGARRVLKRECGLHDLELAEGQNGANPCGSPSRSKRRGAS
jgi:hypothetical protein